MNTRTDARARPAAAERVKSGGAGARLRAWREQHLYSLVSSLGRLLQRPFATLLTVGVMAVAIALYVLAAPLGLSSREVIHIIVSTGLVAGMLRFGLLERRVHNVG